MNERVSLYWPLLLFLGSFAAAYWLLDSPETQAAGSASPATAADLGQVAGHPDVEVTTLAGDRPGFADGPAWQARFFGPNALVALDNGDVLVCDSRNHRIRRIARSVTTEAGGGEPGGSGGRADGQAHRARFRFPSGLAAGKDGTVYIADTGNHRICVLKGGVVRTLAGGEPGLRDGSGPAARFRFPAALAVSPDGYLWVADTGNGRVRRVATDGTVRTLAPPEEVGLLLGELGGSTHHPQLAGTVGGDYFSVGDTFSGPRSPGAYYPQLACNLYCDLSRALVVAENSSGRGYVLAGTSRAPKGIQRDGSGERAAFQLPCAVATDGQGLIYVADYQGHRIRRLRLPDEMLALISRG